MRHTSQLCWCRGASPLPARNFPLTNLKTHLIIRISKGQAARGKRETKGRATEDWIRARLQTKHHESLRFDALKEAGCEKWPTVISYFPSCNSMPNISASSAVIFTRFWVISGRIRPNVYASSCPHIHLQHRYESPGKTAPHLV